MGDYAKKMMAKATRHKKKSAKQAINADDARGFRKRKVNAARIKAGKPTLKSVGEAKKQDEKAEKLNRFIASSKSKKPY